MAKGKYVKWLQPENLILLEGWSRNGLTHEEIARNIGINVSTLYDWMNKFDEISNALKEGKEVADLAVENALYKKAINGDTTAIIFWLKNRKASDWREKQKYEVDVDAKANITVEDYLQKNSIDL